MNKFTIEFTAQELDYIANVLAQRPWGEVQALLANIRDQIAAQQRPEIPPVKPYVVNGAEGVDPH